MGMTNGTLEKRDRETIFLRYSGQSIQSREYSRRMATDNVPGTNEIDEGLAAEIERLLKRVDMLPSLNSRPESEILGYGTEGIPGTSKRAG
jgi:hypothetical protein